jgi:hypothetical protein
MHKYRHLIKPFVVCTTDGLIVDVFGPYSAKGNDANILMSILKDSDLQNLLQPNDNIILDRGFRDCIDELKKTYKLIPRMPTCTDGQLTFLQANQTRLVTKVRCVVEVINGIFDQSFPALKKIRNTMIPHIMTDFKIAAAFINSFHSRFVTDKDDWEEMALLMKEKLHTRNEFESRLSKP